MLIAIVGFVGYFYTSHMSKNAKGVFEEGLLPIEKLNDIHYYSRINEITVLSLLTTTDKGVQQELPNELQKGVENYTRLSR